MSYWEEMEEGRGPQLTIESLHDRVHDRPRDGRVELLSCRRLPKHMVCWTKCVCVCVCVCV